MTYVVVLNARTWISLESLSNHDGNVLEEVPLKKEYFFQTKGMHKPLSQECSPRRPGCKYDANVFSIEELDLLATVA